LEAGFDLLATEMKHLVEEKKIQNGRVLKLEKRTHFIKWINENRGVSVFIGLIGYLGFKLFFTYFSVEELLKNYLP
jgi:hypothetical protein